MSSSLVNVMAAGSVTRREKCAENVQGSPAPVGFLSRLPTPAKIRRVFPPAGRAQPGNGGLRLGRRGVRRADGTPTVPARTTRYPSGSRTQISCWRALGLVCTSRTTVAPAARTCATVCAKSATSNHSRKPFPQRLVGIGKRTVVILDVDVVQLQDDLAVRDDLLVLVAAVAALGGEYLLVEAARRRDVADDQHRRGQIREVTVRV